MILDSNFDHKYASKQKVVVKSFNNLCYNGPDTLLVHPPRQDGIFLNIAILQKYTLIYEEIFTKSNFRN